MDKKIYAVANGEIVAIEKVEDPAFSQKMLGDGLAIRPKNEKQWIYAPFDGVITTTTPTKHAIALTYQDHYEVLIHIGIDTVDLNGHGFYSNLKKGDKVKKGDKLIEVDFKLISGKIPSTDIILVVSNLNKEEKLIKTSSLNIFTGDLLFTIKGLADQPQLNEKQNSDAEVISPKLTILNEVGVHARPASVLSQLANKFKSTINIKKGEKTVNAKSMIAVMGLGAKYRDQVELIAKGEDAQEAIDAITKAISEGLGEEPKPIHQATVAPEGSSPDEPVTDFSKEVTLKGVVGSPGLIIGKSYVFKEEDFSKITENSNDSEKEKKLFSDSLKTAVTKLKSDIAVAEEKKQTAKVEIFKAHITILEDQSVLEDVDKYIKNGKTAAFAWKTAIANCIEVLMATDNQLLKERAADYKDVERRVFRIMFDLPVDDNIELPANSIVVGKDLVPSDISRFGDNFVGVILAEGSATSHVSLILRNMGVPALIAVGDSVNHIPKNVDIILDTQNKEVIIAPNEKKLEEIKVAQKKQEEIRKKNISQAHLPATTVDNVNIIVAGNISNSEQAAHVSSLGGDGIGLFRTEFLFISSQNPPSAELQRKLYQDVFDSVDKGDVIIRTLDVGGDKPLPYFQGIANEENPILGVRGVRNYSKNKKIFTDQIKALLQLKPLNRLRIMVPMVSDIYEIEWVKSIIEEEKKLLGITEKVPVGTMVEVPSAALIADQLSAHADFFSIGTNDLTQYTLAMDRGNPNLTARLVELHPAVLKLIKLTVDGGEKNGIHTAVCGAMASDIKSVPILIGLGVKELSVSMRSIPDVKALVRTLSYAKCKDVATKALTLSTADEVVELVTKEFNL